MEKIIFFSLAIPILAFVIYLGGSAIMKGFSAKSSNRPDEVKNQEQNSLNSENKLSDEINKLKQLLENGVLTKEEFEQAKKKILD